MKYILQIPKPCHENWSEMTPTEKGSFCNSCQKEVVDFTRASNYTLSKKLDSNKNICGRFRPDQLNQPIGVAQINPMYRAGILLGLTSIFAAATPMVAQVDHFPTEIIEQPIVMGRIDTSQGLTDVITIKGVVKDEAGLPLPGANIVLKNSKIGTQTDFDGKFSLAILKESIKLNSKIEVFYLGYETKEIEINKYTNAIGIALTMQEDIMGEMVIVRKQNVFDKIGNLFKRNGNRSCEVDEVKNY